MDIIDALEGAKIPYRNSWREGEIWLCCPECGDERFRLGVNVENGKMHCFNDQCDVASRSAEYTFQWLQKKFDTGELEKAAARVKKYVKGKVKLPSDYTPLWEVTKDDYWGWKAYRYLHSRGITRKEMKKKEIGYSLADKFYRYRIIIPVMYKGKLRGIVARDFSGRCKKSKKYPKYKNSIGSKSLGNIPRHKNKDAVLVEGMLDAYSIERDITDKDGIATLGDSLTDYQVRQLRHYKTIYLWPDPDKAGVIGFLKMGKQLYKKHKLMLVKPYKDDTRDPDELTRKEKRKRLRLAVPITDVDMAIAKWKLKLGED